MNCRRVLFIFILLFGSSCLYAAQVITTVKELGAIKISLPELQSYKIGYAVSGTGDFNADGYLDAAIGVPFYNPGDFGEGFDNGAVFIVYGDQLNRDSGDVDLSSKDFKGVVVMGHPESKIGNSIARVGDINADGFDDLAFGSKSNEAGYVLFGRSDMQRLLPLADLGKNGIRIAHTGAAVDSAGDFNGDGFNDVVFGNPFSEKVNVKSKEYFIGRVSILYGGNTLPNDLDALKPSESLLSIRGLGGSLAGESLAGNFDLNRDGFSDLFIMAPGAGENNKGRGFVVNGNKNVPENVVYSFIVNNARKYVRVAKDLNGDSNPDMILGRDDSSTLILWGADYLKGTIDLNDKLDPHWGVTINGAEQVYCVGDVNGDGFGDLAIALKDQNYQGTEGKTLAGCVIFLLGQKQWPQSIDVQTILKGEFLEMNYAVVYGDESFGNFGFSVAGIGDIQGDGFDDVIIGAPSEKLPGAGETTPEKPGAAYVIQGKSIFNTQQGRRTQFKPAVSLSPKGTKG